MRLGIGVFLGLFIFSRVGAFELGFSGGYVKLARDNALEKKTGLVATMSGSREVVEGVDYLFNLQYATVGVEPDSNYIYRSIDLGVKWCLSSKSRVIPYLIGQVGLYDWKIEQDGKTAINPFTHREMKARSLGLGGGVGCLWRVTYRVSADVLLLSHFVFSQNPYKFGPSDDNELLLQIRVGLWYELF